MYIDKNNHINIEIGDKFGKLTVIGKANDYISPKGKHRSQWKCCCECGRETVAIGYNLAKGYKTSCGHCNDIYIGQRFGKLIVIEKSDEDYINPTDGSHHSKYICKCDCGNTTTVIGSHLKSYNTTSCGHCNDIHIGQRFGRLIVKAKAEDYITPSTQFHKSQWICDCDCGTKGIVVRDDQLKSKITTSCGCLTKEIRKEKHTTHGLSYTRIYDEYNSMIQRCYYQTSDSYSIYGGRGIRVCREWYNPDYKNGHDPECIWNFYNWSMANGYSDTLSIDRINVNGDYCPENCRWIPKEYQAVNRRNNKNIFFNGEYYTISQIANILGIDSKFLHYRLKSNNFDLSSLFTYITNEYGITRAYLLDKYGNPIPINAIYFIDEYGFPVNMNEYNINED